MSTIEQLIQRIDAAKTELDLALSDGENTAPIRAQITTLEGELATARAASRRAAEDAAAEDAAAVQAAAETLAAQQQAALEAATALPELADMPDEEQLSPIELSPAVAAAVREVAVARIALEKRLPILQRQQQALAKLQGRIAEEQAKIQAIKDRRAAGDRRDDDAGAITLLSDDVAGLERLLAGAMAKVQEAEPVAERHALQAAEQRLEHTRGKVLLDIANERIRLAEQIFMRAYAAQRGAERALGLHLSNPSGTYRATKEFRDIVYRH